MSKWSWYEVLQLLIYIPIKTKLYPHTVWSASAILDGWRELELSELLLNPFTFLLMCSNESGVFELWVLCRIIISLMPGSFRKRIKSLQMSSYFTWSSTHPDFYAIQYSMRFHSLNFDFKESSDACIWLAWTRATLCVCQSNAPRLLTR